MSRDTRPAGASSTTVLVCPPRRGSFSKRCTRCRRLRKYAAARPEMPPPMTAMSFTTPSNSSTGGHCQCFVHDKSLTQGPIRATLASYGTHNQACRRRCCRVHGARRPVARGADERLLSRPARAGRTAEQRGRHRPELACRVRRVRAAWSRDQPLRHPAGSHLRGRGGGRRPLRHRRLRRLRLHQLLDAAAVAARAGAGRRRMGRCGIRGVCRRRPESWPDEQTTRGARTLPHPRGVPVDRHRHRHAARVGAPLRRRHADP